MSQRTSAFEDFVNIMSRIPWYVNVILAIIAYTVLHKVALTFNDPVPRIEIGQLGDYTLDKLKGSLAFFGQLLIPFGFLLAGLVALIKKAREGQGYFELILYITISIIFFGFFNRKMEV